MLDLVDPFQKSAVSVEEFRVGTTPFVDEFPEGPVLDGGTDPRDLSHGDGEVVVGEELLFVRGFFQLFDGVTAANRTCARQFAHLVEFERSVGRDVASFLRIQGVGGRVEDIAAESRGEGKHRGVACTEEVDAGSRIEAFFRGKNDVDKLTVSVAFH